MVRDRLAQPDAADGFLLDGFPRNVAQADELDGILDEIGMPAERRARPGRRPRRGRAAPVRAGAPARSAGTCGTSSTTRRTSPDVCDRCGGELYQRDDDHPETVRHRLEVYASQTAPLIEFYAGRDQLVAIDALGTVEDVTERAIAALTPFADQLSCIRCPALARADPAEVRPSRSPRCARPGWSSPRRWTRCAAAVAPGVSTADLDAVAREVLAGGRRPVRRSSAITAIRRSSAPRSTTGWCTGSRRRARSWPRAT